MLGHTPGLPPKAGSEASRHGGSGAQWADLLELKISGQELGGRLAARVADAEHLLAEIKRSPSPEQTGAVVLHHVDEYDEEFFEALAELIAQERAHHHLRRARKFEALRDYPRVVCRRASKGQVADMWKELGQCCL